VLITLNLATSDNRIMKNSGHYFAWARTPMCRSRMEIEDTGGGGGDESEGTQSHWT
jgi:hypothetical protein